MEQAITEISSGSLSRDSGDPREKLEAASELRSESAVHVPGEVDLENPSNGNTFFTVNNAFPEPALAHVILWTDWTDWTDWSHPTADFHVFLTGYDTAQVNLADVFVSGKVPITADLQTDAEDQISPHGGFRRDGGPVSTPSGTEAFLAARTSFRSMRIH